MEVRDGPIVGCQLKLPSSIQESIFDQQNQEIRNGGDEGKEPTNEDQDEKENDSKLSLSTSPSSPSKLPIEEGKRTIFISGYDRNMVWIKNV